MMWVCKTLFKIRGTQRTSNHCILMRRSEDIVDQSLTPPKQRLGGVNWAVSEFGAGKSE